MRSAESPAAEGWKSTIRKLKRPGLIRLWEQVLDRTPLDWPAGRAFEYLVMRAFEMEGAEVSWPFVVPGLEQIDGALQHRNQRFLIEAKDTVTPVSGETLAKLRAQLLRRPPSTMGVLFSARNFTPGCVDLAHRLAPLSVLLWTGAEFDHALRHGLMLRGLEAKLRFASERALPAYNVLEVSR